LPAAPPPPPLPRSRAMALQWVARRTTLLAGNQQWLYRAVAFSFSSSTRSPSLSLAAPPAAAVPFSSWLSCSPSAELCGRGDKKTKRGKRFKGSYGNARPKLKKKIERIKDKLEVPRSTPWPLPFKLI
ncbi:hypothetical protein Taro_003771, partial [Colocasia esculenta]|nr:hypothetical protein [Colocasia esculenta]